MSDTDNKKTDLPPIPDTVVKGATLQEVYSDDRFFEGPSWDPVTGKLYFTAFAKNPDNQQILRLDAPGKITVWMDKTEGVNGTFLGNDGRLLCAQCYGHRVLSLKIGEKGPEQEKALASDPKWNQPNDVCQGPVGNIYFTDPDFAKREKSSVFLLEKGGDVKQIVTDMAIPNGLIVTLDGKILLVGDSWRKHWRAYPILKDGTVGKGSVFFDPDVEDQADPDGMTMDEKGNLYFTGRGGVWAVRRDGKCFGFIPVPEFCSNLCFGGKEGKTLFLTCKGKVYQLPMTVRDFRYGGQCVTKSGGGSTSTP